MSLVFICQFYILNSPILKKKSIQSLKIKYCQSMIFVEREKMNKIIFVIGQQR